MLLHEVKNVKDVNEILDDFKHNDAKKYAETLIDTYGEPDGVMPGELMWRELEGMKNIRVKDESIPHNFPAKHHDYVYSSREIEVPEYFYSLFANVSGSITIDGLKNTVTARCGTLSANSVTLSFVEDVISGNAPQEFATAKEEYGKRIKNNETPSWFKNKMEE